MLFDVVECKRLRGPQLADFKCSKWDIQRGSGDPLLLNPRKKEVEKMVMLLTWFGIQGLRGRTLKYSKSNLVWFIFYIVSHCTWPVMVVLRCPLIKNLIQSKWKIYLSILFEWNSIYESGKISWWRWVQSWVFYFFDKFHFLSLLINNLCTMQSTF